MPLCPIKWWPLKFFAKLHKKSSFNGQYSWRRKIISGNWNPLNYENHEKYFLFHLNKLNILLANQILHILWIFIKPYAWWFKNFTGLPFCGSQAFQAFSRHFFWEQPSKYYMAEFTAIFVCLLLSWSRRYPMKWSSNFDDP